MEGGGEDELGGVAIISLVGQWEARADLLVPPKIMVLTCILCTIFLRPTSGQQMDEPCSDSLHSGHHTGSSYHHRRCSS